jgi:hypothetical protein
MMIGGVRPMIGRGPIDLWARSKRFIATSSGLIGAIDRIGSRKVARGTSIQRSPSTSSTSKDELDPKCLWMGCLVDLQL